jgi:hypothetical protein
VLTTRCRAEATNFFADERVLWGKVIKQAGILPTEQQGLCETVFFLSVKLFTRR